MRTSFVIIAVIVSLAFGMEPWVPFRLEYSSSTQHEMGFTTGLWWTKNEDQIPLDAYGPIVGVKALMNDGHMIPGLNAGLEANAYFLCARMQCGVYLHESREFTTMVNPQIGLTWLSLVNMYVGYNKRVAGVSAPDMDEVNLSFCVNLPSYFFKNAE